MKTQWYTVVGICNEQRHAYYVQATVAEKAEQDAINLHNEHGNLYIAGVLLGKHTLVDDNDSGIDWQRHIAGELSK